VGVRPFFMGTQPLFEGGEVRGWAVCMVDGHCHHWRVGVDAGGWVAILCGQQLLFVGAEWFFMGAQPLFGGGEVHGWAVCIVDGHCHHWRVGAGGAILHGVVLIVHVSWVVLLGC